MADMEWKDERRKNDSLAVELMKAVKEKVESIDERLSRHIEESHAKHMALLKEAFPDGDSAAHRAVHEAWISEMKARTKLKEAIIEKIVTGGVWGTIVGLGAVIWYWLKGHL